MLNFIDTGLLDLARQASIEAIEKLSGMMGEEATRQPSKSWKNQTRTAFRNWRSEFCFLWYFGALIALIIGLVLKNKGLRIGHKIKAGGIFWRPPGFVIIL